MDTHCQEHGEAFVNRRMHVLWQALYLRIQQGCPWRTGYGHCHHRGRKGRYGAQVVAGDTGRGTQGSARREYGLLRQHEADSADGIPKRQDLARPLPCVPGSEQVLHESLCRRA